MACLQRALVRVAKRKGRENVRLFHRLWTKCWVQVDHRTRRRRTTGQQVVSANMAFFCNRCVASTSRLAPAQPLRTLAAAQSAIASFSTSALVEAGAKGKAPGKLDWCKHWQHELKYSTYTAKKIVKRQGGGFSKAKAGGAQAKQKAEVSLLLFFASRWRFELLLTGYSNLGSSVGHSS